MPLAPANNADCYVATLFDQKMYGKFTELQRKISISFSLWWCAEGSFDTCLLLFVLHHIADSVQTTLREAARVAKRVPWAEKHEKHCWGEFPR